MHCRSHSRRRTIECLFLTACGINQYAEEKRTENNLIVRSGISEAETTNNKRLRSTFYIQAIQTGSIARPLCDSRASCISGTSIVTFKNKNLAIANRSRVSCAHNTLRASIGINITRFGVRQGHLKWRSSIDHV